MSVAWREHSYLGLSSQHTRGSALLGFVKDDAAYLADRIATRRLVLTADAALDEVPAPDIIVIPGSGKVPFLEDPAAVEWVRRAHETSKWTTSVCTGSMLLGAAGILQGKRATSHWAVRDSLRNFGAEPVPERVVIEGKVITAGGVSAGIDMALTLAAREAGEDEARALQLVIEYDPQPPYDSGSLEKAEPETKQRATEVLTRGVA